MPPRKELCRNFQRGSCQYGDRCKFLHATPLQQQQQPKTNPFGFGAQNSSPFQNTNQQQKPNPFGFGVQNNAQSRGGGNDFGSKPNQFKPFENKWSRFSPINNGSAPAQRPSETQSQTAHHKCTDPEACKRLIMEDLKNERPLWTLTSYGHNRDGPCDVVGDISCEELRALAYDDAKQGKSLQSIIERERGLLNSKVVEFQNLVQKPFAAASNSPLSTQSPFGGAFNASTINSGVSAPVSSFLQLNTSQNTGPAATPNYAFGQPSAVQNNSQSSGFFQTNNPPSNLSGAFGSQFPQQSVQSSFSFGGPSSNSSSISGQNNLFSSFGNLSQTGNAANNPFNVVSNVPNSALSATGQSSISTPLTGGNSNKENTNVDDTIWSKAEWKWNSGEIPEEAPPQIYIH